MGAKYDRGYEPVVNLNKIVKIAKKLYFNIF